MNLPGDNGITPFHSTEPGCLWERSKFIRKAVRYTPAHSSTFDALPSPPSCKYYMNTGLKMLFTRTVVLQDTSSKSLSLSSSFSFSTSHVSWSHIINPGVACLVLTAQRPQDRSCSVVIRIWLSYTQQLLLFHTIHSSSSYYSFL